MVVFAVELDQGGPEILAYLPKHRLHCVEHGSGQHTTPVLGYEYQMDVKREDTRPTAAQVVFVAHRPMLLSAGMAHRYRLVPSAAEAAGMRRHCADARYVWNLALEQASMWRRHLGSTPSGAERMRQLAEARRSSWLGEGSSTVQQAALRDFDRAMRQWWAGVHRRPTWRKVGVNEGFVIRDLTVRRLSRKWATVLVPKVGPVKFRLSRPMPPETRSARVTLDRRGRWHVSFTAVPPQVDGPGDGSVVGVDRGVANTVALSTGELASCPQPDWKARARLQRRLARQRKGSNRRARTVSRVARLTAREADRRKDWIEKTTTDLARSVDLVALEDLRVRNMVRSVAGTVYEPGVNVAQKRGLNRGIQSQAWGLFERRLRDKIGDRLVMVPSAFTSQTCSACGFRSHESRESQARFVCRSCGVVEHADVNAARNIAAAGLAVSGRGGNVSPASVGGPVETSTALAGGT